MIMKILIKILNKFFNHRTIVNCERTDYLTRWYLFRRPKIAFFLHRFHRSDEDRALHDHPWSFLTFILYRGYVEHTEKEIICRRCHCIGFEQGVNPPPCKQCGGCGFEDVKIQKRKWPGMICFRPAEWKHRVELVKGKPAWTLVIRFKERREWGFWEKAGFVPWNKWWQNNCE